MVRKIIVIGLLIGVASTASANNKKDCMKVSEDSFVSDLKRSKSCVEAPEIDPGSAIAGLTLLVGGIAVIGGRRRKSGAVA